MEKKRKKKDFFFSPYCYWKILLTLAPSPRGHKKEKRGTCVSAEHGIVSATTYTPTTMTEKMAVAVDTQSHVQVPIFKASAQKKKILDTECSQNSRPKVFPTTMLAACLEAFKITELALRSVCIFMHAHYCCILVMRKKINAWQMFIMAKLILWGNCVHCVLVILAGTEGRNHWFCAELRHSVRWETIRFKGPLSTQVTFQGLWYKYQPSVRPSALGCYFTHQGQATKHGQVCLHVRICSHLWQLTCHARFAFALLHALTVSLLNAAGKKAEKKRSEWLVIILYVWQHTDCCWWTLRYKSHTDAIL